MEKTIKYLENGEYHYATVKDVGDLAKLKTDSKDDLVTAINELFITGGEAPKKPDGYDELVDNVADAIQKQQQMTDTITNMQQSAQLSDAEMQHMKQVQEEAHQEYLKAIKELNDAIAQANADALELDKKTDELKKNADDLNKKTNDLQDKLNETFTNVANEVSAVHKQLDTESAGLHKELNDTKTSLEATRKDLLNNTQEFGVVNSEVKELKDKMDRRIWSTDLDPVREQVSKNSTEVAQTKDELKSKADQSNLDLVTNSVENLSTQVKENADGLKVSVKKDELGGDVAKLLNDKTNLLLGTRNFSGDSWSNKTHWHEEPGYWKGLKVFSSTEMWSGLQYKYEVKQGQQYTFSFWARQEKDNSSASIVLSESDKGDQGIATPYVRGVHIGTEWKRYSLTFQAESDGIIYPRVEQNVQGNKLYIAGYKLELGSVATPWEPNEADVAENIEHNESQFNVYSDQIAGIVKKQEKMGDTERQLDTRITETAEGLKQNSKDLQDANGKITEFKGQLESTARGLKTEYEKYTNDAIGQISDSSLNLIRNSAFQNKDDNFAQWQNVSAKANIREDSNGLRWVELTQSGMTTDNPQGITSNYFVIKQGKVTVAVDIKLGDKANLDNQNILLLELYNDNKQRVDFTDVSVSQLGLSTAILNDHNVHRGLYRLGIDRKDVKYMTVKAILHRNGDLWFTNFSARLSSIDDGGYTPNPDDLSQQILKMNTKIEEDAEHIALKANSVDVTRDIKSAVDGVQVGGTNLLRGTSSEAISGDAPTTGWKDMGSIYNTSGPLNEKQYVLSFDARGDVDKQIIQTFLWAESLGGHNIVTSSVTSQGDKYYSEDGNSYFTLTTQWTRYWVIYNVSPDNTRKQVIVGRRQAQTSGKTASGKVYIKSVKLEEGNKSTSWSPAPEDTSAEIKSAKDAAIQVASDQINIHVNELSTSFDDKLNRRVNEVKTASEKFTSDGIEQVVTKVTDVKNDVNNVNSKLDNLQVGTRNLLHHSDTFDGWHKGSSVSISSEKYIGGAVAVLQNSGSGGNALYSGLDVTNDEKHITWTVYARADNNGDKLHTELWGGGGLTDQPLTTEWKRYKFAGDHADTYNSFYLWGVNTNKGNIYVALPFAVVGNTIGSWSPNPDDVNQSIKDATEYKVVTGTIDFNNLKTQQKIFYKDTQATNTPAGGSYWYYLDVEPGYDGRILQTAISDRDNITWVRTFADSWSPWVKQADQRNIDDLNNQINGFKTETTASVKNLGDRVATEVSSITTKVNGLQSGGQNLIQDSDANAEYATPWDNTTFDKHPFYYNGTRRMFVISNSSKDERTSGCPEWFPVQAGKQYTLNFQGFMSENVSSYDVWLLGRQAGTTGIYTKTEILVNAERLSPAECLKVTRTFTVPSDWKNFEAYIRFDNNGSTDGKYSAFFFNEISLKEGNLDTGYSPSPADTADQIKKLNTKWDVANGQIQGKVTETDVNNILNGKGYATQSWAQSNFRMKSDSIELEVRKITDPISNDVNNVNSKLDNLRVGGTNLLKNSVGPFQPHTDHPIDNYDEYPDSVVELVNGEQYTISGTTNGVFSQEHNTSQESDKCVLWLVDDAGINQIVSDENTAKGTTFIWEHPTKKYVLRVNTYHPGSTNQIRAWKIKIEKGNKATDWSPAPEDTSAEIKSAKDDAINVASGKIENSSKELRGEISSVKDSAENRAQDLDNKINSANGEFQKLRDATQWHVVFGPLDLNTLKSQTRIFYQDTQESNTPITGWQYIVVDATGSRVTQTIWKDNSAVQYVRQFIENRWTDWTKRTDQDDIDKATEGLRTEIKSAKDAAINVASDKIEIKANELKTTYEETLKTKINEVKTASEKYTSDGIEQVVTKVTNVKNDIDRLGDKVNSVGSRNLLHNTSDRYKTLTGNGYLAQSTASDIYTSTANYHSGDWFTYAATITNNSSKNVTLETWLFKGQEKGHDPINVNSHSQVVPPHAQNQRVSTTFAITAETYWIRTYVIFDGGGAPANSQIQVKDERLVEGKLAGSWSPNPDDINRKIDTQTLDSANIDDLKTQGHYFVRNLTGNPIGGWVYVDVTGNNNDRLRQDVYQDSGSKHMYRRLFGTSWSGWEQGAYLSDVNAAKTEVTASVKNLGDRVTTEVSSVETRVTDKINGLGGGRNFVRGTSSGWSDWSGFNGTTNQCKDIGKLYWNGLNVGDWVTFHVHYQYQSITGASPVIAVQGSGDKTGWSKGVISSGGNHGLTTSNSLNFGHFDFKFQVTADMLKNSYHTIQFRVDNAKNGWLQWAEVKAERGVVRTPWSPAPEDTAEAIKTLNTKWDVANGQIQGKVTATDVNNILNGKGYATQSWAQTMFTMKSDAITLQAVRDNITNGIQNQVNGINKKIDTQTLDSANIDNMRTQGHYFVKNLTGNPIPGWVYVDVSGNNNDRIRQDVYQDSGYEHRSRRWYGSYWTEWTTDVNNKNIVSQINITPDQIKIASNKIVIDGNTDIHGTLRVPEVKLQGNSGYVDLSGDGINIAKNNGAGMNIGANAIQITSNTNGQAEVEGVITPAWSSNNVNQNGIGLVLTTEQDLGRPYGGDILTIGTMLKGGVIHSAMVFDATGITSTYNKGFNWFAPHTLNGDGGVFRFPNAQDDLVAYAGNIPGSRQAGYSQPTLALVHGQARGSAGLQFQWDDLVPFGRINSSNTRVSSTAGSGGLTVSWYSWGNWWGDMKAPAIVYVGDDGKYADGGIVFYPGGEVCVWHQQFRSYLQYGGLHQTD